MSKPEKITDLDKFVKQHIRLPFSSMLPENHADKIRLKNVMDFLSFYPDWAKVVSKRISKISFRFPDYIQHPLVDYVKGLYSD